MVSASGEAMATKKTAKKRPSKAPTKKATKKRASKAPTKKRASTAPAQKRPSKAPTKKATKKRQPRPTLPAKPRAKRMAAATSKPAPASAPAPTPASSSDSARAPSSRPPSYLESTPSNHAELVSGLFQVVRGAAKDLKTLVSQAISMSQDKRNRSDR